MLLNDIKIQNIAPCVVVSERVRFTAHFSDNISEVMPYLNNVIKNAVYNPDEKIISFTMKEKLITLYPREVTVAKALDEDDAREFTKWLKNFINDTFDNKENITPIYERRSRPSPLVIYGWLPQKTNCMLCGEQSCMAFAAELINGNRQLQDCSPLWDPGNEDLLESLKEMLGTLGV
ncbi:MAG: Fe-S cluster protein [Clostridiales bacterium]|nr:Fe-S cluster protein [Clostridiales bacterium]MCF8023002.1 Fe-S cluster protein [Clostridiales bacterium]